ncbi:hypothetical protein L1987_09546 [Smallanthus sonchifolius]|uniref:Uncharacterized protein n=1 Tax=Smallanthus sonchifolius TaxID=185202 RepID=A0ACB9JPV3_9ASTR|nr:hypothetical protein L1987_09546 [Smallanthus sonchifolius]
MILQRKINKDKMDKEKEDNILIRNLFKGKKQKVVETKDEAKKSGKKLELIKKGKGKEKVEEELGLKVDSGKKKKKEPKEGEDKIRDQKKRKTVSETIQKHFPFTGNKLLMRYSRGNLITFFEKLTKAQRKVVEEMGFGKTLLLKLHTIPSSFGYWLLENYDASTDILNDGANEYKLTPSHM